MDWHGIPLRPLTGGHSSETFLAGDPHAGSEAAFVVRLYRREPARAAVDAALLRLVRGLVPVPRVVDLVPAYDDEPGVLVTEYVDGTSVETLLGDPARRAGLDLTRLGDSLGRVLGRLGGMPFLRVGTFAGPDLALEDDQLPGDLADWAQQLRDSSTLAAWPHDDWRALLSLLDDAQQILDAYLATEPRTVLVHSDFNPKNLLVDPDTLEVTALLDWEFAYAGLPAADLGNLLRFERDPLLTRAVLAAYRRAVRDAPDDAVLLERARTLDLYALLELASRRGANPVTEQADALLLAMARSGDLHAPPPRPAGGSGGPASR